MIKQMEKRNTAAVTIMAPILGSVLFILSFSISEKLLVNPL